MKCGRNIHRELFEFTLFIAEGSTRIKLTFILNGLKERDNLQPTPSNGSLKSFQRRDFCNLHSRRGRKILNRGNDPYIAVHGVFLGSFDGGWCSLVPIKDSLLIVVHLKPTFTLLPTRGFRPRGVWRDSAKSIMTAKSTKRWFHTTGSGAVALGFGKPPGGAATKWAGQRLIRQVYFSLVQRDTEWCA